MRGGASEAGAFGDESLRTFFAEIKGLVNAAFHALYEEVQRVANKDTRRQKSAMERGLAFMNDRRNESAIIDSVVESEEACRSLTQQYFSAMHAFVRETVPKARDILHVNFVPFGTFIARLYRKLSRVPEMREAYFTTMSYTEKDVLLRDVLRQVMQTSVVWPAGPPSARPSFSTPIKPSDSVSKISKIQHARPTPSVVGSVVGQSVANAIMSAVREDSGLTPDKLSTHNKHDTSSRVSHFTNFTTPSVAGRGAGSKIGGGASSKIGGDPKVIRIGQTDPHALPRGPRGLDDVSVCQTARTETEREDE